MENLVCIIDKETKTLTMQHAAYIEDGPYIELKDGEYTVWEIPSYGGEKWSEGVFYSVWEAIDRYCWILKNHT